VTFFGKCDKKRRKFKKYFRVRERHILPRNVTNVTRHIFCQRKKWQMWRHSPKSETGTWPEIGLRPTLSSSSSSGEKTTDLTNSRDLVRCEHLHMQTVARAVMSCCCWVRRCQALGDRTPSVIVLYECVPRWNWWNHTITFWIVLMCAGSSPSTTSSWATCKEYAFKRTRAKRLLCGDTPEDKSAFPSSSRLLLLTDHQQRSLARGVSCKISLQG